jgi:DNA-binding NtrC family response regulator
MSTKAQIKCAPTVGGELTEEGMSHVHAVETVAVSETNCETNGLNLLIIDDERSMRDSCGEVAHSLGFSSRVADTPENAYQVLETSSTDIVLLDLRLPGSSGLEVLREIKQRRPDTLVIVMTGFATVQSAVQAMKLGAYDYVTKPFNFEELRLLLERAAAHLKLTAENRLLREQVKSKHGFGSLVGHAPEMEKLYRIIAKAAHSSHPVLILGESGTGKELVARSIHYSGPFRDRPFIPVDCGSLVPTLIESELFGYVRGAFTGAVRAKDGLLTTAEGGTIFLDEVGEMPPATQVKLLRVLEDREFYRVGGAQPIKVDVRVTAATNQSLREAVTLGRFRDDLYYRLNVLYIYLPPLRERRSDIPLLVHRFIAEFAATHERTFRGITPEALQILVDADWPGNVRQLRNLIESMVVLAPEGEIRASDIPRDVRERRSGLPMRVPEAMRQMAGQELEFIFRSLVELKLQLEDLRRRVDDRPRRVEVIEVGPGTAVNAAEREHPSDGEVVYHPGMTMAEVERAAIEAALRETKDNRRKAAELLGIGERTLYRKIKEYAIA